MMGTSRDQGLLTAAFSQAETLAPNASVEPFVAQGYVDSPPEQPPRARRRTAAGAAAAKQSPDLVIHTTATHTSAAAPAAAAVAAVGYDSIRVADDTVADGDAAVGGGCSLACVSAPVAGASAAYQANQPDAAIATDAVSREPDAISPAVEHLHGVRKYVNGILSEQLSQGSTGVPKEEVNMCKLVAAGEKFLSVLEELREQGCIRFDIGGDNPGGREQRVPCKNKNNKNKDYILQLTVLLNEGGQQLSEAEWKVCNDRANTVMTSDKAGKLDFELGRSEPAIRIKSVYREKHGDCFAVGITQGVISTGRCYNVKDSSKLVAFRQAVFRITVVMMIIWHCQGRPLAEHPSLKALKEKCKPVRDQEPAKAVMWN